MAERDEGQRRNKELENRRRQRQLERERQVRRAKMILAAAGVLVVLIIVGIVAIVKAVVSEKKDKAATDKQIESVEDAAGQSTADSSGVVDAASATDESVEAGTASATDGAEAKEFDLDMTFVGDCCMATNLEDSSYGTLLWYSKNVPNEYFFDGVRSYFEDDDITVANCENTFSDSSIAPRDKGEGPAYWFKAPTSFASVFTDNSIEAVTINNNHTNDYGPEVFEDTKAALDAAGVEWGFRDKIIYYEKEGFKIGVVCVSIYSYPEAEGILPYLELAKENSDFQIIFFHGGVEGQYEPSDWKVQSCHMLVDQGADLILGAHPHVLQKRENYNGVDIVYSLGNFCFGGNDHPGSNRTIIYKYKLKIHSVGDTKEVVAKEEKIIPCYVYTGGTNNWQPYPIDDGETFEKVIKFMDGEIERPE